MESNHTGEQAQPETKALADMTADELSALAAKKRQAEEVERKAKQKAEYEAAREAARAAEAAKLTQDAQALADMLNAAAPEALKATHVAVVSETGRSIKFAGKVVGDPNLRREWDNSWKVGYRGRAKYRRLANGKYNTNLAESFWTKVQQEIDIHQIRSKERAIEAQSKELAEKANAEIGIVDDAYKYAHSRIGASSSDPTKVTLRIGVLKTVEPEVAVKAMKTLKELGLV